MASTHVEFAGLSRVRPPVLLLGGINLVRALGLAGIPAIVASSDPGDPAFASRYCSGRCVLPSLSRPEAVIDTLLDLGARLFEVLGRRVPLMYGNDDYLELIYAHRDRLRDHFTTILNETEVARALMEKSRSCSGESCQSSLSFGFTRTSESQPLSESSPSPSQRSVSGTGSPRVRARSAKRLFSMSDRATSVSLRIIMKWPCSRSRCA